MDLPDRLKLIIKNSGHTPASFADEIDVQRSTISHIISGRNKPGLDFLQKVALHFPQTDLQWLITGQQGQPAPVRHSLPAAEPAVEKPVSTGRRIERIVIFYADHSFEEFRPGN